MTVVGMQRGTMKATGIKIGYVVIQPFLMVNRYVRNELFLYQVYEKNLIFGYLDGGGS